MVRDQVICKIYSTKDVAGGFCLLENVLESEKCLIIADGLDEWTHPENIQCTCKADEKVIPFRTSANKATVLTTTRPWRLSQFRVKDSKIEKYLEIEGVEKPKEIVKKIVPILNNDNDDARNPGAFMEMVEAMHLKDLLTTPIIITLLVCLWFEGVPLTNSKCYIYAAVINMLSCRHRCIREKFKKKIELPPVFKYHECFTHNPKVYLALAKLAYTTLFSECRESSVVFSSDMVNDMLEKEQAEFALKAGLLTEKKSNSLIKRTSHFSFFHKTVQEFLSALHLCLSETDYNQLLSKYEPHNKQTVLGEVSQVFIFICGMKPKLAVQMSTWINGSRPQTPLCPAVWTINDDDAQYDNDNVARQEHWRLILSGYREAHSSNFGDIPLTLPHFLLLPSCDVKTFKYLMNINKDRVESLFIFRCNDTVGEQELQQVFRFSSKSLKFVALRHREGQYDLSKCDRLEYLSLAGGSTTHIHVDTTNIKICKLQFVSAEVESYILSSFRNYVKGSTLQELVLFDVQNIALLCETLPKLSQLQYIRISLTKFGKLHLPLPASIISIVLYSLSITAEAVWKLVKRIENITHTVDCVMDCCSVEPTSELEEIQKYVDSSPELGGDGKKTFKFTDNDRS